MKFNANLYKSFNNLESKEAVENMSTKDIPLKKFKMTFFIKKKKLNKMSKVNKRKNKSICMNSSRVTLKISIDQYKKNYRTNN